MKYRAKTQELEAIADALVGMVQQHTEPLDDGSYRHSSMRADEHAYETLVEYGYAVYVNPDDPYAIRFIDKPAPDLVRTIADYEGLPEGTILEVVEEGGSHPTFKVGRILQIQCGNISPIGWNSSDRPADIAGSGTVCSVVRLGGEQSA